jgi:TonB family protein
MAFEKIDALSAPMFVRGGWLKDKKGQDGSVSLEFTLNNSGVPRDIRVLHASDPEAAGRIEALVAKWQFAAGDGDYGAGRTGRVRFRIGAGDPDSKLPLYPPEPSK